MAALQSAKSKHGQLNNETSEAESNVRKRVEGTCKPLEQHSV